MKFMERERESPQTYTTLKYHYTSVYMLVLDVQVDSPTHIHPLLVNETHSPSIWMS
jgi:hypothetical protein